VDKTGANATVIFVPPPYAADAIMEAADAEIELIVCITEGIPDARHGARLGVPARPALAPDRAELSGHHFARQVQDRHHAGAHSQGRQRRHRLALGHADLRSRASVDQRGIGQSTAIGIGGDPIIGTNFVDALDLFNRDPQTEASS
jgi:succinyl-CoA synthetase alpha subunit